MPRLSRSLSRACIRAYGPMNHFLLPPFAAFVLPATVLRSNRHAMRSRRDESVPTDGGDASKTNKRTRSRLPRRRQINGLGHRKNAIAMFPALSSRAWINSARVSVRERPLCRREFVGANDGNVCNRIRIYCNKADFCRDCRTNSAYRSYC